MIQCKRVEWACDIQETNLVFNWVTNLVLKMAQETNTYLP